jgi:hypothetical protein
MHCDSLVGEDVEGGSGPIVHEPPRRVFVRLPGTAGVAVSDYLYPGEGSEDSLPAIQVNSVPVDTKRLMRTRKPSTSGTTVGL